MLLPTVMICDNVKCLLGAIQNMNAKLEELNVAVEKLNTTFALVDRSLQNTVTMPFKTALFQYKTLENSSKRMPGIARREVVPGPGFTRC